MLEAQRIAYLEALGITQYVAIKTIAGSMQLPILEYENISPTEEPLVPAADLMAEKLIEHGPEVGVASVIPAAAVAGTEGLVVVSDERSPERDNQEIPELDLSKLGLKPKPSKPPEVAIQAERLGPFSCLVVTLGSGQRIMLQLSTADAPGLSAVEHRMLSDLLCAVGEMKIPDQQSSRIYRWPVINNARIAGDPVAAKDAICAFLSAAEAVSDTLIIGQQVSLALGLEKSPEVQVMALLPGRFLALPGFAEMQADWKLKADLWPHIRAFLTKVT